MSRRETVAPRTLALAYASGGFGLAVNSMIAFLLPLRANELGIGIGWIGVLLAAKGATEAIASVPVGATLDRIGSRSAYILGTSVAVAAGVGYATATSLIVLLLLQILLGAARPLAWIGAQAYAASLREGEDRARDTGRMSFVATGAQIVAPAMVGVVAGMFDTSAGFIAFSVYCGVFALVGLGMRPVLEEPRERESARPGWREGLSLLRNREMRVAMYLTFVRLWIPSVWTAFFPLLLVTSGISESVAGSIVAFMAFVATFVSLASGQIVKHVSPVTATAAGLGLGALGLVIAPLFVALPLSFLSAALVGVGQGLSLPLLIMIVTAAVDPSERGLALGLRGSVNQVAAAIAPMVAAATIGLFTFAVGLPVTGFVAMALLVVTLRAAASARHGLTDGTQ